MTFIPRSKTQLWKAIDWLISLIIWLVGIAIAAPFVGFIASVVVKFFLWGKHFLS